MIIFSADDIYAARNNDLESVRLVMDAVSPVIDRIAAKLANEVRTYGSDLADELAAEGRLSLWELISKHDGNPQHGSDWLVMTVRGLMLKARTRLMNPGADFKAVETFLYCLARSDNDPARAEHMAYSLEDAQKRLSKPRAAAARMACSPVASLDVPTKTDAHGATLLDLIADKPGPMTPSTSEVKARHRLVNQTIDGMPERQAICITALERDGLPIESVAEDNDLPKRTLQQEWSRARKTFWQRFPWIEAYGTAKPALQPKRDVA